MRLAWFRATAADPANLLDDTAHLVAELGRRHGIEIVREADAHNFVWKHFRAPFDLCVFEMDNTAAHRFIWPYLFHYPGVLVLRCASLHDSRAITLERHRRIEEYAAEFAFDHDAAPARPPGPPQMRRGTWPMLRAPLLASRLVVVPDEEMAATLQADYPDARIRYALPGVAGMKSDPESTMPDARGPMLEDQANPPPVLFGTLGPNRLDVIERALRRAQDAGTRANLLTDASPERVLRECHVVLALAWPDVGASVTPALAAMAAARPVVVFEAERTAGWPALDPQTWRPRGTGAPPVVVSIDPRDEEHSLMLVVRRLSADAALRHQLGTAAYAWWRSHATVRHATEAWEGILSEAASLGPPPRPARWPAHLDADGTSRAREILGEFGVSVDFL